MRLEVRVRGSAWLGCSMMMPDVLRSPILIVKTELPPYNCTVLCNPKSPCTPNSLYFGLKVVPIGTLGPKYILFGYMDPEGRGFKGFEERVLLRL